MNNKLEMPIEYFVVAIIKKNARLNAEIERMRAALRQIAGLDAWDDEEQGYVDKARAALGEKV